MGAEVHLLAATPALRKRLHVELGHECPGAKQPPPRSPSAVAGKFLGQCRRLVISSPRPQPEVLFLNWKPGGVRKFWSLVGHLRPPHATPHTVSDPGQSRKRSAGSRQGGDGAHSPVDQHSTKASSGHLPSIFPDVSLAAISSNPGRGRGGEHHKIVAEETKS